MPEPLPLRRPPLHGRVLVVDDLETNREAMTRALASVRGRFGREYDLLIDGRRVKAAEKITSPDVQIRLIKDGDHRLSRQQDIALLLRELDALLSEIS